LVWASVVAELSEMKVKKRRLNSECISSFCFLVYFVSLFPPPLSLSVYDVDQVLTKTDSVHAYLDGRSRI
jgi:hypothetical protein